MRPTDVIENGLEYWLTGLTQRLHSFDLISLFPREPQTPTKRMPKPKDHCDEPLLSTPTSSPWLSHQKYRRISTETRDSNIPRTFLAEFPKPSGVENEYEKIATAMNGIIQEAYNEEANKQNQDKFDDPFNSHNIEKINKASTQVKSVRHYNSSKYFHASQTTLIQIVQQHSIQEVVTSHSESIQLKIRNAIIHVRYSLESLRCVVI